MDCLFCFILDYLRAEKVEYKESLRSFFNKPKMRIIIRQHWKKRVYNINTKLYYKNIIWEYFNDDIIESELILIIINGLMNKQLNVYDIII